MRPFPRLRSRAGWISLLTLAVFSFCALAAPWISPYEFDAQEIDARLGGPSLAHWLGTDALGRDLLSRVFHGARLSLAVGFVTALAALVLGTAVGAIAGYRGGRADRALLRVADVLTIFPSILLAILASLYLGRGFGGILASIALTSWVTHARIVRALFVQARELPYVESARAAGAGHLRIIGRHLLPNLAGPISVSITFQVPANILTESFLSFLGLGLQPPYASWGTLAAEGFRALRAYPHLLVAPATALFVTVVAFQYLGDALRDALDPKPRTGWVR